MPDSPAPSEPDKRAAAEQVVASMTRIRKHMAESFRTSVANSRVVEIPGASHNLFFRTHEVDVVREMRTFLEGVE